MRWTECYICKVEDESIRKDGSLVQVYECWCCWKNYCDKHGEIEVRICQECLNSAYEENERR